MLRKSIALVSCLVALPLSLFTVGPAEAGTGHARHAQRCPFECTDQCNGGAPTDCGPGSLPDFKAGNFPHKPKVDNTWLPMEPGTRSEFSGTVKDLTTSPPEVHTHRIVSIVTGLTKEIDGVRTVVLWDRDYSDGVLARIRAGVLCADREGCGLAPG